ncbi:MAG: hypothetical protein ACPG5P_03125, partial [Saprospiraceae bacterium]
FVEISNQKEATAKIIKQRIEKMRKTYSRNIDTLRIRRIREEEENALVEEKRRIAKERARKADIERVEKEQKEKDRLIRKEGEARLANKKGLDLSNLEFNKRNPLEKVSIRIDGFIEKIKMKKMKVLLTEKKDFYLEEKFHFMVEDEIRKIDSLLESKKIRKKWVENNLSKNHNYKKVAQWIGETKAQALWAEFS